MSFTPIVWFAVGRLAFGLIERWRWRFLWTELLATAAYLLGSVGLLRAPDPAARGLLIGGLFLVTAVIARFLAPRHPIEASEEGKDHRDRELGIGIIDFVWLAILAGTLAILAFALSSHPFNDAEMRGPLPLAYIEAELSNTVFLLGKTVDSVFLLGGVLAGCMTILWAGEIWRKRDPSNRRKYISTTVAAIRMVVAFLAVITAALYWIGVPLYQRMNCLTRLLR